MFIASNNEKEGHRHKNKHIDSTLIIEIGIKKSATKIVYNKHMRKGSANFYVIMKSFKCLIERS